MHSYEAAYNLEAGVRDGLTLNQAEASILKDEYSDGSAACAFHLSSMKSIKCPMPFRLSIKLFVKERASIALRGVSE